jgi:hypothetical protein
VVEIKGRERHASIDERRSADESIAIILALYYTGIPSEANGTADEKCLDIVEGDKAGTGED